MWLREAKDGPTACKIRNQSVMRNLLFDPSLVVALSNPSPHEGYAYFPLKKLLLRRRTQFTKR